jgi:tellurite methyltransferase
MSTGDQYNKIYSENKNTFGAKPDDLVAEVLRYISSGSVMDLGAGEGRNALFLAQQGFEVMALDVSEVGLAKLDESAKENGLNVCTQLQDIRGLVFDRDFDIFICALVLHLLPKQDALNVISQMQAHTALGGLNIVKAFTQNGDFYAQNPTADRFYLNKEELKEIYNGWEILKYEEVETKAFAKKPDGTNMTNVTAKLLARKIVK